jgi:DNA-binding SARP family transcriptional activator
MASLALHLLGTPRIEVDNVPIVINRRKVLALLVYLTLTQRPHRRDYLATLFWPDYDQTSARANLRRTLSTLNKTLDGDWLHIDGEQVSLKQGDNFWLDVDQFHQHLTSCTTHGHSGSDVCADCLEPLSRAASLYQ